MQKYVRDKIAPAKHKIDVKQNENANKLMADICKKGKNLYFHSDSSSKRNRGNSQEGVAKND